ncbi:hypothetical protein LZ31DRAFT_117524 [Colletotrichum somersetense]|nr:hypothetical protein LZ31DRAFT_117524 [Colletotrichum somersetense]
MNRYRAPVMYAVCATAQDTIHAISIFLLPYTHTHSHTLTKTHTHTHTHTHLHTRARAIPDTHFPAQFVRMTKKRPSPPPPINVRGTRRALPVRLVSHLTTPHQYSMYSLPFPIHQ